MLDLDDLSKLEALHSGAVPESSHLEYKASPAIQNTEKARTDISKDISAMANADGGAVSPSAPAQVIFFVASSLYTDYVLGIQTTAAAPKPDYFAFSLPTGVVSGSYSINNAGTSATGTVLYGHLAISASPVPGPVVGAGLPGLVIALGGLIAWRRRRMEAALVLTR